MPINFKKRIGILRGGIGENYHDSLNNGGHMISYIREHLPGWDILDVLIDKEGVWHIKGLPIKPADMAHRVDVAWNTTHPEASVILKNLSIPYIGQEHFYKTMKKSRDMFRNHLKKKGIGMPRRVVIPLYQEDFDGPKEAYVIKKAKEIHEKFGAPWMVKSFTEDKSMGIHLAKTFPELVFSIEDGVNHGKSILIEEFIAGKVASVHSVAGFRNEDTYIFPLGNTFGTFSHEEREALSDATREIYRFLGVGHYLKSDFILTSKGKVHLLEVEDMPDLKQDSHFREACALAGAKTSHVIEHMLEMAASK